MSYHFSSKQVIDIAKQNKTQAFANLVRAYRKEHIGKGPEQIKVFFKDNWAVAHMT
ncbi:Na-translocating system protein MpsC family protein, partial [Staphylococcus warneri]|uniref:Na-translocating system protein MpsC family protein n=1 Tax=Staphylococcus warneri TaxID=1292 RepID=UPI003BF85215